MRMQYYIINSYLLLLPMYAFGAASMNKGGLASVCNECHSSSDEIFTAKELRDIWEQAKIEEDKDMRYLLEIEQRFAAMEHADESLLQEASQVAKWAESEPAVRWKAINKLSDFTRKILTSYVLSMAASQKIFFDKERGFKMPERDLITWGIISPNQKKGTVNEEQIRLNLRIK